MNFTKNSIQNTNKHVNQIKKEIIQISIKEYTNTTTNKQHQQVITITQISMSITSNSYKKKHTNKHVHAIKVYKIKNNHVNDTNK